MGDTTLDVCYMLPDQEGQVDEALFRQLELPFIFRGPRPRGGLQPPQYLWERQHNRA